MLIVLGVVSNIAYSNRVGSDDPLVTEVLSAPYSVHKLATHVPYT